MFTKSSTKLFHFSIVLDMQLGVLGNLGCCPSRVAGPAFLSQKSSLGSHFHHCVESNCSRLFGFLSLVYFICAVLGNNRIPAVNATCPEKILEP